MASRPPDRASDFEYQLPPDLIAQTPLPDRAGSRMLVVRRDVGGTAATERSGAIRPVSLEDRQFRELPELIPPGDLLVLNTTRVRHARLLGTRPSGAPAEVLLIHPATDGRWLAIGQPGSALRPGKRISLEETAWVETLEILPNGERLVRLVGATPEAVIARHGRLPLPPYITREPTSEDEQRYQTVYAEREGSVAAPTAGLHFSPAVLDALAARGVRIARLDLEVGPGTFRPVEVENLAEHPMHPERYEIPTETAELVTRTRQRGGRIWAVGTTVVRALESAVREGVVAAGPGETRLLIVPGYRFRVVDRLLTNFHLPRSTLLMLVCAFAGHETTMAAYHHAVAARYRFYSYGDAMVIV
jgi:S-adenosylmethionine:tRNA ribosyltransferase-isomerase